MPSMEKGEEGFGNRSEPIKGPREHNYQEEMEGEGKREPLTFLMKSGRAQTPEEAEHYLESLARLKEKLIIFAREQVLDEKVLAARGYGMQASYPLIRCGQREATKSDLDRMSATKIDRNDPTLWE